MLGPLKTAAVSVFAAGLGVFGLGLSVAAIVARWLPFTSFAQPQIATLEAPVPSVQSLKASRRRSVPTSPKAKRPVSRKRPTSVPVCDNESVLSPCSSSGRRVYFADSPKAPSSRHSRFSLPNDSAIKPILNSPVLSEIQPTGSPRSSLSSISILGHGSAATSLNDDGNTTVESDSSSLSSHPSGYSSYSSYFPRLPMPKLGNPLTRSKRKSSGSVSSVITSTITTPESPGLPATPPCESPISPTTKQTRRSSLGSWYPWSASSPRRSGTAEPEGTNSSTTTTRRFSHVKSVSKSDDETTVTTTTTTSTSVVSTIVSAGYFSKKPQKAKRRTSTPVPRTQPYAYPINAAYPTMYDEEVPPPPPYQASAITTSPEQPASDVSTIKRERNAQAQAALGVGEGRRPSMTRRAATFAG
ncbi:hypothetical protein DL96DRAFT_1574836 [Flagelloscypha sp. PMI_526]|nr:hypothetical protein DL96DRAFT_1574836 [Flagelloscypha sp. PMI_526]